MESVRRATLFVYFMMRAWGLKATDAIGLDRPYEGAERAQTLYVVAEKVMKAQKLLPKITPKAMVDGDFGSKVRVIEVLQPFSLISTLLSRFSPYFLFSYLKGEKRIITITLKRRKWWRAGLLVVIFVKIGQNYHNQVSVGNSGGFERRCARQMFGISPQPLTPGVTPRGGVG